VSAGFQVAGPVVVPDFHPAAAIPPVHDNAYFGTFLFVTAVELQYEPDTTYDGHFVSTNNPAARAAIQQMLVTTFRDGVPTVSP
jgi:hypothetical protein